MYLTWHRRPLLLLTLCSGLALPVASRAADRQALSPAASSVQTAVETGVRAVAAGDSRIINRSSRSDDAKGGAHPAGMRGGWMWRYLFSMLAVGGLLLLCMKVLTWCRGRVTGQRGPGLQLRQRLSLDSKTSVVLLAARDVELLLACSPGGVVVLERWPAPAAPGKPATTNPSRAAEPPCVAHT